KDPPGLSWLETKDGIHKSTNNLDDILCLAENEKQRVQQIHRKGSEIQVYSSLDMVMVLFWWQLSNTT
ncbi:8142_t:CDS:1, partial [Gigaspora rosea]